MAAARASGAEWRGNGGGRGTRRLPPAWPFYFAPARYRPGRAIVTLSIAVMRMVDVVAFR
jgi:hypothetical protein